MFSTLRVLPGLGSPLADSKVWSTTRKRRVRRKRSPPARPLRRSDRIWNHAQVELEKNANLENTNFEPELPSRISPSNHKERHSRAPGLCHTPANRKPKLRKKPWEKTCRGHPDCECPQCPQCSKCFGRLADLRRHKFSVHRDKSKYQDPDSGHCCYECHSVYRRPDALIRHWRNSTVADCQALDQKRRRRRPKTATKTL